jgi:glyoxylase-like metal-dependent hydrolase (beta-lactamase superfamily II)
MLRSLTLTAVVAALSACTPPAAQDAAPAVQIYAMECGRIAFADTAPFADDGAFNGVARDFVDPCYLIRHPEGDLVWDLGFPDAVSDMPDGLHIAQLNAQVTMPVTLASQLEQLGLTPADVEYISISHSHFDHVGNAAMFAPTATWIVDADERAYMFRDEARADAESFAMVAPLEGAETVLIEGDARHDVFGDGSVVIIQAPGHTPGHTVLLVRTANSGNVLLTGDMFHMAESRAQRTVPSFNVDRDQTLASMDLVESIAAEENARVVRQHVAEDFEALPRFPEALN